MQLSEDMVGHLDAAHRFLLREPERSRRVLRLLCANWLAHVETPELRQRKPADWVSFPLRLSTNPIRDGTTRVPLYPVSPAVPAGARSLPPRVLASADPHSEGRKPQISRAKRFIPGKCPASLQREMSPVVRVVFHHPAAKSRGPGDRVDVALEVGLERDLPVEAVQRRIGRVPAGARPRGGR